MIFLLGVSFDCIMFVVEFSNNMGWLYSLKLRIIILE